MGLSFAIPTNIAMDVVKQLKNDGEVARGWLGVVIQDVNRNLARSLGLEKPTGAIVAKVLSEGPAGKAGIQVEDVILTFNGREIENSASLRNHVGSVTPGKKVDVVVSRAGKKKTLDITLGRLPKDPSQGYAAPVPNSPSAPEALLGMVVSTLSKKDAAQWGISGGVIVQQVSGSAKAAGIRQGDVITNIANQPVLDKASFTAAVKQQQKGKWVPILINRRGVPEFLAIEIE